MRGSSVDMEAVAKDAEQLWNTSAALRAEFGSKETYLAFRKAEARGLVKISGRGNTIGAESAATVSRTAADDGEAEWNANAALRAEFAENKETYLAYHRAQAAGRVRGIRRGAPGGAIEQAGAGATTPAPSSSGSLSERQALVRQQNVGRQFAGLPLLDLPQE